MKQMIKLGLALAAFAAVSCFGLALVNNVTAPVIKQNADRKLDIASAEVFPGDVKFETVDGVTSDKGTIKIARKVLSKDGALIGVVVEIEGATYEKSDVLVGIKNDADRTISGVRILSTSDSPGFGSKSKDDNYKVSSGTTFYGQFEGKKAAAGFVCGDTFEAISGATITSKGIGNLLTGADEVAAKLLKAEKL